MQENTSYMFRTIFFRSNHSTELVCVTLTDHILKQMDNNNIPINIYLDLSKAFGTLDHAILIKKLYKHIWYIWESVTSTFTHLSQQ